MSCGVGPRWSLDLAFLWPKRRPAATALIHPLASKLLYGAGAAFKSKTKQNKKDYSKFCLYSYFLCFFFLSFLGLHPQHMEVPRLGVELELSLLVCATVTAMQDPSHVCNLHHSSQQCQILNLLNKTSD